MSLKRSVLTAMIAGSLAAPAWAQQAEQAPQSAPVAVERLGIDVSRIHRQLQQSASSERRDGLSLKYFIDVYAPAPRLQLFANRREAQVGPVPYGEPTHREMLDVMTPREYRAPAMDFGALMRWLSDKGSSK